MMSSGSCTSDLAMTAFCWFPPDSSMTRAPLLTARTCSDFTHLSPTVSTSRPFSQNLLRSLASRPMKMFDLIDMVSKKPSILRSSVI